MALTRATRGHRDVRMGSSVRGAIDLALLLTGLASCAASQHPAGDARDAAYAALSGRIRIADGSTGPPRRSSGAAGPAADAARARRARPTATHRQATPRRATRERPRAATAPARDPGARTLGRKLLAALHEDFDTVSPAVGRLGDDAFDALLRDDCDAALALLHDLARATDPTLRALARRLAAQLSIGLARAGTPRRAGVRRLVALPGGRQDGDLDLERTLERLNGRRPPAGSDLVVRSWRGARQSLALLVDHSGSMRGRALAIAGLSTAAMMVAAEGRARCHVIAFAGATRVVQDARRPREQTAVLDDLLGLSGGGVTNLADALRVAAAQLCAAPPGRRIAIALSDCLVTAGGEPASALDGIDCLHVLGTSAEPDAVGADGLARRAGGEFVLLDSVAAVPRQIAPLLAS